MASYKSRAKRRIKNKIKKSPIIIATILILAVAAGIFLYAFGDQLGIDIFKKQIVPTPSDGEVMFHFIDVGQGDSILITTKSGNMLIDTGDNKTEARESLVNYLKAAKVDSFEYVVFTHVDADHIGSAAYIIENYDVKNVIMPDDITDTAVFEKLIAAMEKKEIDPILIGEDKDCEKSGYTFYLGSVLNTVLAPTETFSDPNEMSVVLKCEYGDTSFLLTGDAETKSEKAMLEKWSRSKLKCDVLKVGHHGSDTSTSKEFLNAVSPSIAVICCGKNNKFDHPKKETLDKLEAAGVKILRTDLEGHIVIKTDGKTVTVVE